MSFWGSLAKVLVGLFGDSKTPSQPPTPEPPAPPVESSRLTVHIVVRRKSDGGNPGNIRGTLTRRDWPEPVTLKPISYYMLEGVLPAGVAYGATATVDVEGDDCEPFSGDLALSGDMNVDLLPMRKKARRGVVRVDGRNWSDDDGFFYPLTLTLLWAVGGWHRGESARVIEQFRFIKAGGGDAARILGQVNWPGEEIDYRWPNYNETLAAVIDAAYDEGLRVKITGVGGGCDDPAALAYAIRDVVALRREKVLLLEAVNEGNASPEDARRMTDIWRPLGLPTALGLGNQGPETIRAAGDAAGTSVDCIHTERVVNDPARAVRQAWDFHEGTRAQDNGEPMGIQSSVATLDDPFYLAAQRAASIICGGASYCLHTGAGVYGHANRDRPADLWDAPRIREAMAAVRAADSFLPVGVAGWRTFNTGHPVKVGDDNCDKLYGARDGSLFAEICIAAKGTIRFVPTVPCSFEVFNPATGERVSAGDGEQRVDGLWAYVVVGRMK